MLVSFYLCTKFLNLVGVERNARVSMLLFEKLNLGIYRVIGEKEQVSGVEHYARTEERLEVLDGINVVFLYSFI